MARNDQNVSYTPDAFDEPPEGPVGVHRGNPAWYAVIFPYVVALIIAIVAGLIVWAIGSGEISHLSLPWNHSQQAAQSKTEKKAKSDSSREDEDSDDDEGADSSKDNKSNEANKSNKSNKSDNSDSNNSKDNSASQNAVDKSVAVKVINATKINGYGAKNADKLKQAGYANVTAGNPTGTVPSDSVVWYKDESQKAAALDVAKALGITAVENEKDISAPIVAVLCK